MGDTDMTVCRITLLFFYKQRQMSDTQFSKVSFDEFDRQIKQQIGMWRDWRPFVDCSICGEYCWFITKKVWDDYRVAYDSSCDCGSSYPQERSIEYMFNCLDMQSNEKGYMSMAKTFSLELPQ